MPQNKETTRNTGDRIKMSQREHINQVLKFKPSGFDPYIETHKETENSLKYSKWEKWEGQTPVDERSVLPNEIVIDIDAETTEKAKKENKKIITYLQTNGLPFFIADTGGTGYHIHIFFQIPENKENIRAYRIALYNWLKKEAQEEVNADTSLWDDGLVKFDSNIGKGHLVRAVGGRKTSTGHRKTVVSNTQLEKKQVEDLQDVEYPNLNTQIDFWIISKIDDSKADLTWKKVTEKAEKVQEQAQKKKEQKLESTYQAEDEGLEACRNVPATEVLKLLGRDHRPGEMIECPCHNDSNPSAKITDGKEKLPENRLICFADSCREDGETYHFYNSIDILMENGRSFEEAKQELSEEFDIELDKQKETGTEEQESYNALEKASEEVQEYNKKYPEYSAVEKVEKQKKIFNTLLNCSKQERTVIFDEMKGNKRDLRSSFAEYSEKVIEQQENEEKLVDRYDKEVIEKAEKLLEEEHILKKVKTVLDHKIAGEDVNKLGLFLQLLSKDTDKPLMIFGIQKQGEGKSYLAKQVINLFPDHMVEKLTDATKSSIYRIAETEGKDYFDGKIVFFGEIPEKEEDREVFQIFRQLVSEGEVQKRLTLDRADGMESAKLELKGSPVLVSTTVNEGIIDEQDMSRGMAYSPDMSKEQNRKVMSFQNREHEFPDHLLEPKDINNLEEVIECALDILSQDKVKLQNPFVRDINKEVPKDSDNIKRDYPKTLQIASEMPAYLYHRQRHKQEIADTEYTFVSWEDVVRGVVINRSFINNMIRGRTESTMDAYNQIKEQIDPLSKSYSEMQDYVTMPDISDEDSFTNKDLEKWMGIASQTARSYTRKLDRMELIYKDSSTRPNRHYLVDDEKSETAGITLRSLYKIIASVFERKELGEWARKYIEFNRLEGCVSDWVSKVSFTEEDLPIELDIGLEGDNSHTTPLYQQLSEYKVDEATSLKIEKKDSKIMCGFGSVSKQFSGDLEEENSEPSENSKDNSSEQDKEETKTPTRTKSRKIQSEKDLLRVLKSHDGKLFKSELEDLGVNVDQALSLAAETDKVNEGFGTPENSSQVENCLEIVKQVKTR